MIDFVREAKPIRTLAPIASKRKEGPRFLQRWLQPPQDAVRNDSGWVFQKKGHPIGHMRLDTTPTL